MAQNGFSLKNIYLLNGINYLCRTRAPIRILDGCSLPLQMNIYSKLHQMNKQRIDIRVPSNPDRLLRSYDYLVVNHVSHFRRTAALNFD